METTWKPHEKHGELTERGDLPDSVFAFPKQRKEPMTDASHVRNAIARFDQTVGVSDEERKMAFANIKKAANHYGIDMSSRIGTSSDGARALAAPPKTARSPRKKRRRRGKSTKGTLTNSSLASRPGQAAAHSPLRRDVVSQWWWAETFLTHSVSRSLGAEWPMSPRLRMPTMRLLLLITGNRRTFSVSM